MMRFNTTNVLLLLLILELAMSLVISIVVASPSYGVNRYQTNICKVTTDTTKKGLRTRDSYIYDPDISINRNASNHYQELKLMAKANN